MSARRLILASASPRRQSLLREAGYDFLVRAAEIDEAGMTRDAGLSPRELPTYLARAKAEKVAAEFPGDVVLGADTIVALNGTILGKAEDADDARRILRLLSGSTHQVITGLVLIVRDDGLIVSETVASTVQMRVLTGEIIEKYIATGRWEGKAGAYGIQDDDPFVAKMEGCLTNIVGLPMPTAERLLREAGIVPVLDTGSSSM